MMRIMTCLRLSALFALFSAANAADFYVSPIGDDSNSGKTPEAPFKTLTKARDELRKLGKPARNLSVELSGGTYFINETFKLGLEDSAAEGFKTTYECRGTSHAMISGGVEIKNWQLAQKLPAGANPELKGKLWEADVSEILKLKERANPEYAKARGTAILTLYRNIDRLRRAVSDGFLTTEIFKDAKGAGDQSKIIIPESLKINADALDATEVIMHPDRPWKMDIMPVESYDPETRVLSTKVFSPYQTVAHSRHRYNAWLENYAPALNWENDWIYSEKEKKIYIVSKEKPEMIYAPVLTELVKIEGKINSVNEDDEAVNGICFKNILFINTERFSPDKSDLNWGVQHDWDYYDRPTAALRLRGAKNCEISDCAFVGISSGGLRMDLFALNNSVKDCLFAEMGGTGALLSGYGMGRKKLMKENVIENNYFIRCGKIFLHQSAVHLSMGLGNVIKNNTVRDCQYNGITVTGQRGAHSNVKVLDSLNLTIWEHLDKKFTNEKGITSIRFPDTIQYLGGNNVIEFNDVSRTGEGLGDTNAIYVSGCGLGNIVRGNVVHDMRGWGNNASIRMDDNLKGALIERNITFRNVGLGIIVKSANDILNNFFIENRRGRYSSGVLRAMPGAIGISLRGGSPEKSEIKRNIICVAGGGKPAPFQIHLYTNTWPLDCSTIDVDGNLYWMVGPSQEAAEKQISYNVQKYGWDRHSLVGDPKFANMDKFDFSFLAGSAAKELGIDPIDVSKTGIQGKMKDKYILPALESPKIVALNFKRPEFEEEALIFSEGMKVRVISSKGAESVRYTLDGSYPNAKSPEIPKDGEITIKKPCTLHVAAFAMGKWDYLGDRLIITPPPQKKDASGKNEAVALAN